MAEYTEKELAELYRKNKAGDPEAREKLLRLNLPLVHALCKRYHSDLTDYDDIFQEGCIGLIKALDFYDPNRGTKFSTYAVPVIMGEIKNYLRRNGHLFKVSRSYYQHYSQLLKKKDELQQELNRQPRLEELSEKVDLPKEEIAWLMELQQPVLPLSEEEFITPDMENMVERIMLQEKLNSLSPRERQVIVLRYFLEKSQEEVAKLLGISQSHVSRLERQVISGLKESN